MKGTVEFRANADPLAGDPLRVWQTPDSACRYVVGADVAEGLEHGDYSCAQVVCIQTGEQVAMWHGHLPPDEFADEIAKLGYWYGTALVGVEANNHGLTTVTALRNLRYPTIYRRRTVDRVSNLRQPQLGWLTTRTSKPLMIDDLGTALRAEELTINDQGTITELMTYTRNERGQMGGSPHDDRVMALAIANQMRKFVFDPEHQQQNDDYWTMSWWKRQALDADQAKSELVLGSHNVRK